jgi:hypothetical protein
VCYVHYSSPCEGTRVTTSLFTSYLTWRSSDGGVEHVPRPPQHQALRSRAHVAAARQEFNSATSQLPPLRDQTTGLAYRTRLAEYSRGKPPHRYDGILDLAEDPSPLESKTIPDLKEIWGVLAQIYLIISDKLAACGQTKAAPAQSLCHRLTDLQWLCGLKSRICFASHSPIRQEDRLIVLPYSV